MEPSDCLYVSLSLVISTSVMPPRSLALRLSLSPCLLLAPSLFSSPHPRSNHTRLPLCQPKKPATKTPQKAKRKAEEAEATTPEESDGDAAKMKKNKNKKKKKKSPKKTPEPDADTSKPQIDDAEGPEEPDQTPAEEEGASADEAVAAPVEAEGDEATPEEPYNGVDMSEWIMFDLDPRLLRALAELGFTNPTPIQRECILPAVRDFRDILGAAETGSGKTLAFGLPILQHILQRRDKVAWGCYRELPTTCTLPALLFLMRRALHFGFHLQNSGRYGSRKRK